MILNDINKELDITFKFGNKMYNIGYNQALEDVINNILGDETLTWLIPQIEGLKQIDIKSLTNA